MRTPFMPDEEFEDFAKKIIADGKKQGRADGFRYPVTEKQGYTIVAFVDMTAVHDNVAMLIRCILAVGTAMLFAFLSRALADRIIRPLEENDEKQKQFIFDAAYEMMGIFVHGAYFTAEDNGDDTYTCGMNVEAVVGNYSAKTAPVVFLVNTPGYSAMNPPIGYVNVAAYTDEGFVYLCAGCRGVMRVLRVTMCFIRFIWKKSVR